MNEIADSEYDSSSSSYSSEDDNILEHQNLLEQLEQRRAQPVREDTSLINLGTDQCPRMIKICSSLNNDEISRMTSLLKEFEEVFTWSYKDMPGIDSEIVQHRLPTYLDAHLAKALHDITSGQIGLEDGSNQISLQETSIDRKNGQVVVVISEFDITYVNQKSVKGQAISDHLTAFPVKTNSQPTKDSFPDEDLHFAEEDLNEGWQLYFDGATNQKGFGAGVLLITLEDFYLPMAFQLEFGYTNNIAEYEACVIGLEMALSVGVEKIKVFGDSSAVICQTEGKWRTKDEKLKPYQVYLEQLARCFKEVSFEYLPRDSNRFSDALATLASMVECDPWDRIRPFLIERRTSPAYGEPVNALTKDRRPWYAPIVDYIRERRYPKHFSKRKKRHLRKYVTQFILQGSLLYKRSYDGIQLLCVDEEQAQTIIEGNPPRNMWTTHECKDVGQEDPQNGIFANIIHIPPTELHSLIAPWPFSTWRIDVIGKITPKASNGHEFVLVAIDYFTKWVEAQSYAVLTAAKMAKFIKENIICRYDVPQQLILDQGLNF
ncbi:uncharacterized protein LOC122662964 [Telopea speciosissima]|uniref:uncharacterized protein LOC122662964 n=1 Tax=Telopea speciosissima TaxID=54955 RepID=UPI001CC81EBB|nr:uncharacterized protein LOC122662964 [Telopea speciosissima]